MSNNNRRHQNHRNREERKRNDEEYKKEDRSQETWAKKTASSSSILTKKKDEFDISELNHIKANPKDTSNVRGFQVAFQKPTTPKFLQGLVSNRPSQATEAEKDKWRKQLKFGEDGPYHSDEEPTIVGSEDLIAEFQGQKKEEELKKRKIEEEKEQKALPIRDRKVRPSATTKKTGSNLSANLSSNSTALEEDKPKSQSNAKNASKKMLSFDCD